MQRNGSFDDFDELFNQFFKNDRNFRGTTETNKQYYVNGKLVSPEELQRMQQEAMISQQTQGGEKNQIPDSENILDKLGRNLTQEARDDLLDEIVGRKKEIQETAEILSRRIKNNPILVGEAGVGKTAIVEGLAQAIVKGNVPAAIKDKEVYSIDISNLEAGTQYRGSFEENIKNLVEEVKSRGNIILFFDEIHQILGAGSVGGDSGSKGLADILKPALSRGEISLIGATTQDEYRNTILKNSALARRFNEVQVLEPSSEECLEILKGIASLYENHHNVVLDEKVLKAAIDYSVQYIPQRLLPDKAIDLIDMTAAHLAAKNPIIDRVTIEKKIKRLELEKENAAKKEDFKSAAKILEEITKLKNQLKDHEEKINPIVVTKEDIAQSVERLTGIPVSQMSTNDIEKLKNMNERLKGKVIGQDEAVEMISRAIRRNRAGFDEGNRPIGSFLFVGPTGVGKTELAKQLAFEMFGNKEAIVRLDMSEYSDLTAVSKLIGTTAGYVGYEDNSNTLTEKVRRNPYSIILLDEIEKANPQILTLLLQLMDDGRLTDGQGNVVNFKNTVIIATSNAGFGNESLSKDNKENKKIEEFLSQYFRPEFLNRFNGIVEFSHLTKEDLMKIVDLMIDNVNQTLERKNIVLDVSDEVKQWLVEEGYDEALGARPLRRVIEQQLRDKITDFYLENQNIHEIEAVLENGSIKIIEKNV
ncbi:AAA family ATPase [Enterococcus faecalis]|uniref:AAA family ATPase n=1 Tax=Enterococcus faecalis TaxID=1351 RepID=UPI0034CDB496